MHTYIHTYIHIHTHARTHTHAHTHAHIRMWMQAPFRIPQIKCLMKQLLAGTEFMHRHWVIHRDMKTSNLLLDNGGNLKICDFGLARKYRDPIAPMTPEVCLARVVCVRFCFTAIRSHILRGLFTPPFALFGRVVLIRALYIIPSYTHIYHVCT